MNELQGTDRLAVGLEIALHVLDVFYDVKNRVPEADYIVVVAFAENLVDNVLHDLPNVSHSTLEIIGK